MSFERFHNQVDKLKKAQTLKNARDECRNACIDSRRAILLLSLTRLGYNNKEQKIERFLSDLNQAHKIALDFAEKYKSDGKLLKDRASNMGIRAKVVKAMLDEDMNRVCKILDEAIEEFEKNKANKSE